MHISPAVTQWAQAHVFDLIWFIGASVGLVALRAALRGVR